MSRELSIRLLFYLTGMFVISFGVSLTITADLGAGAWDALNVGLSSLTGLTVGNWVIIIGFLLILVNAVIAQEKPNFFAIITIFVLGFLIDFWLITVMTDWIFTSLIRQIAVLLTGVAGIGLGVAMYLQAQFPLNPVDGLMVALQKRWKLSLIKAKTLTEGFALLLALVLGGPIGIGTILILLSVGPAIQLFDPVIRRLMHSFI